MRLSYKILLAGGLAAASIAGMMLTPEAHARSAFSTLPSSRKVIAVGDSITEYAGPNHNRDAWPMRLRNRLCSEDCSMILNDGMGGTCLVAAGCGSPGSRLVDTWQGMVLDQHPTTVIIAYGTNDLWFPNTSVGQIADAYKLVVFSAIAAGIQPLVFTIDPLCQNAGPFGFLESRREQVNHWLTSYFGTGPGSVVVDTSAALAIPGGVTINPDNHKTRCDGTDSMHLSRLGEVVQADEVPLDKIK